MSESLERLQNAIARSGAASRRGAAALVEAGRVTVDGATVVEPGAQIDPRTAKIAIDGKPLAAPERKRTIIIYKPAGVLSTMDDPRGGTTVADLLRGKLAERLVPAGRLDRDSEGLMVMTNDGALALRLTHPRFGHEKTYIVRAAGRWSEEKLAILRGPVEMPDGYTTRPARVNLLRQGRDNVSTLEFILNEGRKRQIRYMCSAAHLTVLTLKRVAIGTLRLPPDMKPGEWRELTANEIDRLGEPAGTERRCIASTRTKAQW
ncbi:MAG: rRNA pseudouridine synthase [Kiritimatiellae bacterium]|nr:rRNA pseudouridine synthase [Kiritimatiellia bacterium]